jgi:hypothetical protein
MRSKTTAFCWFLLPLLGAMATIPNLAGVLRAAPRDAMVQSTLLGAASGIGGTACGISIRYAATAGQHVHAAAEENRNTPDEKKEAGR